MKLFSSISIFITFFFVTQAYAQQDSLYNKPVDQLTILGYEVIGNDTLPILQLESIPVVSSKLTVEERVARRKLKRNIVKVYPYAQRAVGLLNEIESVTASLDKRRHRKKYLRFLESQLKGQFKDELKKLTISQGKMLIKLIERDTGKPFYDQLAKLKNPVSAFFWHNMSKGMGYDLKEGYHPEKQHSNIEEIVVYLEKNGIQSLGYRYKPSKSLAAFQNLPSTQAALKKKKRKK